MRGRQVVLDRIDGREVAALLQDGRLDDLLFQPSRELAPAPGTVFLAVVDHPLKGTGGQFVRLPHGKRGFLRAKSRYAAGSRVPVQISGFAETGKAPPCSDRILLKGCFVIVTPGARGINVSRAISDAAQVSRLRGLAARCFEAEAGDAGLVFRTSSVFATNAELERELAEMLDRMRRVAAGSSARDPELLTDAPTPHEMAKTEWISSVEQSTVVEGSFEQCGIREMMLPFLNAEVPLPQTGSMAIEETRALVAIDVNSGGDSSLSAGLKANLAAIEELPRQLRVRGLGGQVVVDFAPLSRKNRPLAENALVRAFERDPVKSELVGWTPLGNFEIRRMRERIPLGEGFPK